MIYIPKSLLLNLAPRPRIFKNCANRRDGDEDEDEMYDEKRLGRPSTYLCTRHEVEVVRDVRHSNLNQRKQTI